MKSSKPEVVASPPNPRHPALLWLERRRLLIGGVGIAAIGLALSWDWMVAVGALPLLYTLPCAIMMGMCMKHMSSNGSGKSCSDNEQTAKAADSKPPALAPLPPRSSNHIED